MSKTETDEAILRAVAWAIQSAEAVQNAGGSIRVLKTFSDESIITMVRNDLTLSYMGPRTLHGRD